MRNGGPHRFSQWRQQGDASVSGRLEASSYATLGRQSRRRNSCRSVNTMSDEPSDTPELFVRLDGVHVLVVDDDDDARVICDAMLRYAGATVRVAGSALAAARTLRHIRPDVVITDLSMPGNDGLWLIDWIRERHSRGHDHLPVIAITARDDLYDSPTARRHGSDAYLRKPASLRTLCSTVAGVVDRTSNDEAADSHETARSNGTQRAILNFLSQHAGSAYCAACISAEVFGDGRNIDVALRHLEGNGVYRRHERCSACRRVKLVASLPSAN